MIDQFGDEMITELSDREVFVFGSNLAGIHGAGAAKQAHEKFGAEWGVGIGATGRCYAIPTKDTRLDTMHTVRIVHFVDQFLEYTSYVDKTFLVTAIGCGYAGYTPEVIAPMFLERPENVIIPNSFKTVLENRFGTSFKKI